MNNAAVIMALMLPFGAAGCARLQSSAPSRNAAAPSEPPAPDAQAVARPHDNPIIIELISRDQTTIIAAGANGPLYSIRCGATLIARDLSMDDLRTLHPDVYQRLMNGYAQGSFEWAGMNVDDHCGQDE